MSDSYTITDCRETTPPFAVECNSELTSIKLDLYDPNNEVEVQPNCLVEDNLKRVCVDSDVTDVNNVPADTKSSPLSKSRYGRVHKPKIDEDFLSTDKKVGAILGIGILCTPTKNSGSSSKTSTPRKQWHSPDGSLSDITTDLDISSENISRTYREMCNIIFSPQTENFKGFCKNENGTIISGLNDVPECTWKPGDLAWARVGNHPYWPCIVTVDPALQTFKKISLRGLKCRLLIHVQFYGDKGRRSWLSSTAMQVYEGADAFNKLCEEMIVKFKSKYRKLREHYIVRPSSKMKWDGAVSESEAVYPLTRETRLQEFISKYPKIIGDETTLVSPEPEIFLQLKRKAGVSSEPRISKKVRTAQDDVGSRSLLVKKKLSLCHDGVSPGKRLKVLLSPCGMQSMLAESPSDKGKVQAKIERFFSFTRAATHNGSSELPTNDVLETNRSSEDSTELPEKDRLSPGADVLPGEDAPKCETDDATSKSGPESATDDMPKARKSLRHNLPQQGKISVKLEVCSADDDVTAGGLADPSAVPPNRGEPADDKDDSGDEWLPRKRRGTHRDSAAADEQAKCAPAQRDKGKPASEEEEAFYQFSLVHTQIVMDDNPYWSRDKVDSYVRLLWNNLDNEDKTKFGKRTDAEKKKLEGGKVYKPAKRLYTRKKKELDVSDDETESSLSSEDQEGSKESIASTFTFRERKPASLFRGMKTEKVCNVCEMPGDTIRCKGPCLGFYHRACVSDYGVAATPAAEASSAEAVVSSDSGVEESDSEAGETRAGSSHAADASLGKAESAGADVVVENKLLGKTPRKVFSREASGDSDGSKKMSANKRSKKGDKDDEYEDDKINSNYLCPKCVQGIMPPCFACSKDVSESGEEKRQRCIVVQCGKFYHPDCLKLWPQAWSNNYSSRGGRQDDTNLTCPQHTCHTCASDDPRNFNTRFANERLVRCVRCPTAYHFGNYCVPAGSIVLNMTQIICSRHCSPQRKGSHHVNAAWCFICAMGGSLICCDLCPMSFHAECLNISPPEGGYICEDCGTGRFPLYGEIVWAKLGNYRWWPAQIVFPDQVPENIENLQHSDGEFVVRFFGSHDYNWVNRSRVFLYQEGDSAYKKSGKTSSVDTMFLRAVGEAHDAHKELNLAKASREAEPRQGMKPPQYVKIKCNKPVGNVRVMECDPASLVPCYCDPSKKNPCGPDSDCLNRILMVECSPSVCRAGDNCRNQRFEKREYPPLIPYKTDGRGWGLKTLVDIKKGDFVIEYVGEMIDEAEYKRRLERKHLEKDENYYFLTIDKDRMLDAGPKGNVSRFMNHSCQPNCETQKWTVNGDTRVGLFAVEDIPGNTEVTFNYNLQCASTDKKQCMCGAPNCSGFIGSKANKVVDDEKKQRADQRGRKKQRSSVAKPGGVCFQCGQNGDLIACDNKTCPKKYHLKCVNLSRPSKGKWTCPWHQCSVCKKHRIRRRCAVCPNAYCAQHEEGNVFTAAKETYCKEHAQGEVADGSPRCAARASTHGPSSQQPVNSDVGTGNGGAALEQACRATSSKYRTPAERRKSALGTATMGRSVDSCVPASDRTGSTGVTVSELSRDDRSPNAVRKSSRKSLSLECNLFQKDLPGKGMEEAAVEKTHADQAAEVGAPKQTTRVGVPSVADGVEEGGGKPVASRAGGVVDRNDGSQSEEPPDGDWLSSCDLDVLRDADEPPPRTDVPPTGAEVSGSSDAASDSFCEFQESRRKDLIMMRKAQYKRIGEKVNEMSQTKSLNVDLKNLVCTLNPINS